MVSYTKYTIQHHRACQDPYLRKEDLARPLSLQWREKL